MRVVLNIFPGIMSEEIDVWARLFGSLQLSCGGTFFMPKVENFTQIFPSAKPTTLP